MLYEVITYSIGCLLAEILKLANPKGYFTQSRLCLFCGGPVFDRLSPVSKFILDSEANVALYSYIRITSYNVCYTKLLRFASPETRSRKYVPAYSQYSVTNRWSVPVPPSAVRSISTARRRSRVRFARIRNAKRNNFV